MVFQIMVGRPRLFPPSLYCNDDDVLEDDDKIVVPNSMIYLKDDIILGRLGMLVRFDKNKVVLKS